jgi:hypothetical protein
MRMSSRERWGQGVWFVERGTRLGRSEVPG